MASQHTRASETARTGQTGQARNEKCCFRDAEGAAAALPQPASDRGGEYMTSVDERGRQYAKRSWESLLYGISTQCLLLVMRGQGRTLVYIYLGTPLARIKLSAWLIFQTKAHQVCKTKASSNNNPRKQPERHPEKCLSALPRTRQASATAHWLPWAETLATNHAVGGYSSRESAVLASKTQKSAEQHLHGLARSIGHQHCIRRVPIYLQHAASGSYRLRARRW